MKQIVSRSRKDRSNNAGTSQDVHDAKKKGHKGWGGKPRPPREGEKKRGAKGSPEGKLSNNPNESEEDPSETNQPKPPPPFRIRGAMNSERKSPRGEESCTCLAVKMRWQLRSGTRS